MSNLNKLPKKARKAALSICEREGINHDELAYIKSVRHNQFMGCRGVRHVFSLAGVFETKEVHFVVFSKTELPSFRNKLWEYGISESHDGYMSLKEVDDDGNDTIFNNWSYVGE